MKSYVWVTFGFMAFAYYELSGGADFVPEQRAVAEVQEDAPEIVTRAEAPTLLSVSASNVVAQPVEPQDEVTQVVAAAVALDSVEEEIVEVAAPVVTDVAPVLDIRSVAGTRVNMRMGPGTGFDVITTLDGGTKLEVLEINAEGWANVSTVDRGIQGWMAERLLSDPET